MELPQPLSLTLVGHKGYTDLDNVQVMRDVASHQHRVALIRSLVQRGHPRVILFRVRMHVRHCEQPQPAPAKHLRTPGGGARRRRPSLRCRLLHHPLHPPPLLHLVRVVLAPVRRSAGRAAC
jgi:hypothetical protein